MRVIGTAGHVDHGKSTLIAALTGTHPDRLKEEQEREMTIELGFAWLTLPNGEEIGIVDVPGHRDFIGNMLAGVGGIDAVLLVIAADEGVMPQTREHLAILDLLQIQAGIVVISKIDMIDDPDWLDLIEGDIRSILNGTLLANAPVVRVSSRTKTGLDELINLLSIIIQDSPSRPDLGRPRLPIDRVFSIPGFGTVVTGTLLDGTFNPGEEVEILPGKQSGRIRGLQNHKKKKGMAVAGSRTAINISGLNVEDIQRGEVVVHPHQYIPTRMLDISLRLLSDANGSLKHGSEVKLFIGTSETLAKVRLLGKDILEPGQTGWVQLELRSPVVAVRGDRFILRRPSPSETLGGGSIVDPHPKYRHKRFSTEVITNLESLSLGSPADLLLQASLAIGPAQLKDVILRARLEQAQVQGAYNELVENGLLIYLKGDKQQTLNDKLVISQSHWIKITGQIDQVINEYHRNQPLKPGISREELKSRLKLSTPIYNSILARLAAGNQLVENGSLIVKPDFKITFTPNQLASIKGLLERFAQSPFSPPAVKECKNIVGEDVFNAMVEIGELRQVSGEVVFCKQDYDSLLLKTCQFIEQNGQITVAEARDLFKTSRRYVLALLEYLDSIGFTARDGDLRRLRK
ncbi:MAG: selenocysteine-specific translation elongation factor [Chloroflexi bacterium GWB2_49_20]|nr:MAG: selenocysteine-specific translation elongation factor [Chloroflexi bacterium GWB2_49_20]OGN78188.1 MAG: selenocysteine-specific translation elongation factor [Chloroflexi bacterium GWC2_49_37]OGN85224.1 MAG: selenocysteine-specific translation elongation factor [Chloroflexi bacterium GWD2_49_16]